MNRRRVEKICLGNDAAIENGAWELTNVALSLGIDADVPPKTLCAELLKGRVSNSLRRTKKVSIEAVKEGASMLFKKFIVKYFRTSVASVFGIETALLLETRILLQIPMLIQMALPLVQLGTAVAVDQGLMEENKITPVVSQVVSTVMAGISGLSNVVFNEQRAGSIASHVSAMGYTAVMNTRLAEMYPSLMGNKKFDEATLMLVPSFAASRNALSRATMGVISVPDILMQTDLGGAFLNFHRGNYVMAIQALFGRLMAILEDPTVVARVLADLTTVVYQLALTHALGTIHEIKERGLSYIREVLSGMAERWAGPLYYVIFVLTTVAMRSGYHVIDEIWSREPRRKYLYTFDLKGGPKPHVLG